MAALVWSFASPLLAASHVISVWLELNLHWLSFLAAGGGLCWYVVLGRRKPSFGVVEAAILFGLLSCLCLVCVGWIFSDRLFFGWKLRSTQPEAWRSIAREVDALGKRVTAASDDEFWFQIGEADLASAFDHVGLRTEYGFGRAQMDPSGKEHADVLIVYGYKSRRWGVYRGERENLTQRWPHASIHQVDEGLFYFVTPDF